MRSFIALLVIVLAQCAFSFHMLKNFAPGRVRSFHLEATSNDDFALLEKRLLQRKASEKIEATTTKPSETEVIDKKVTKTTSRAAVTEKVTSTKAKPIEAKVAASLSEKKAVINTPAIPIKKTESVVATPAQTKAQIVVPDPTSPSVGAGDYLAGIGLGLAPYLAIPIIAANALKRFVKKPKPLPVEAPKPTKVTPYSKSIGEGAKEGIDELLSGKVTPDLQLIRKTIKLSGGAFAIATVLGGALLVINNGENTESSSVPVASKGAATVAKSNSAPPTVSGTDKKTSAAPSPNAVTEKKVEAAPAIATASTAKVADKVTPIVPTTAPVKVEEIKAPAPKPIPVAPKVQEKKAIPAPPSVPTSELAITTPKVEVKKEVPTPATVPAPAQVVETKAEAPKPEVKETKAVAPAAAPASAQVPSAPKVEEKKGAAVASKAETISEGAIVERKIPKGMEPDKLDLDALKSLRRAKK